MGLSATDKAAILDALLRGTAYSGHASLYLGLHTGSPGADGTANELSYAGYARQPITFAEADASGSVNNIDAVFAEAPETIGALTHFSLHTAATGAAMVFTGTLTGNVLEAGKLPKVPAGFILIQ